MKELMISNIKSFSEKLEKIQKDGKEKLFVISDFDKTLTASTRDGGKKVNSLIGIFREENYLGEEYSKKAFALYNKYSPMEKDPNLTFTEKTKSMEEWWTLHNKLLLENGMSDEMVREVISKKFITLRDGGAELLKRLFEKGIPLIIFSASRAPLIRETLQQSGRLTSNIHIVSNEFEKDKTGKFLKIKGSLIHSLNKNELVLKKENWYADIKKERKNIILLGDSLSDADMATDQDGFNILRIGFLNDLNSLLPLFTSKFDAVLKEDTSILFLKDLIPE